MGSLILPASPDAIIGEAARRSLGKLVRRTWSAVEPKDLVWDAPGRWDGTSKKAGWHLDLICQKLEAVESGDIDRLVICVPPGSMKSLLASVFYPAWRWLRDPSHRMQFLSGSNSVRKRDSRRCRKVIKADDYAAWQHSFGRGWHLAEDQNTKINFENSHGGFRQCLTIGGKVTGDRADEQVCDDPYDVKEATKGSESRIRERMSAVIQDWDNVLANRLNDAANDPRILIMQRLHPSDLAGELIKRGWHHVVLPMEYEPDHPNACSQDPREEPGELLFTERMPRDYVDTLKKRMTPAQYAAQYQQRPTASEGSIIKQEWIEGRWHQLPNGGGRWIQSWDLRAGGKNESSSYAVGQLWFQPSDQKGSVYLVDQKRGRWDINDTLAIMRAAQSEGLWKRSTAVVVEEKADGRAVVPMLRKEVPGVVGVSPKGSKEARLQTVAPYFSSGSVRLPAGDKRPWAAEYVAELTQFPGAPNDDQVDATTQALEYLLVDHGPVDATLFV